MLRFGAPFLLFILAVGPALATHVPTCFDDREALGAKLLDQYQELPVWRGIDAHGVVVELWASNRPTWTITMRTVAGKICIVNTGKGWVLPPAPSKDTGGF